MSFDCVKCFIAEIVLDPAGVLGSRFLVYTEIDK